MLPSLIAVLPTAGVLFLFWIGIRALVQADRRERQAQARIEAAERREDVRAAGESAATTPDAGAEPGSGSAR